MEQERKVEPIGGELVRRLLPRRDPEGHKGVFGKVLCLCGSVGYTGAPVFASRGAVRSGAGLVFLGVPESIWPVAAVLFAALLALEHPVTVDIQVTGPESRRISIEGVSL